MNLDLRSVRESLVRAHASLHSVTPESSISVSDLILYPQDTLISHSIDSISEDLQELHDSKTPDELMQMINSISYTPPPPPTTWLNSYK